MQGPEDKSGPYADQTPDIRINIGFKAGLLFLIARVYPPNRIGTKRSDL
jgi:hypothetical protein